MLNLSLLFLLKRNCMKSKRLKIIRKQIKDKKKNNHFLPLKLILSLNRLTISLPSVLYNKKRNQLSPSHSILTNKTTNLPTPNKPLKNSTPTNGTATSKPNLSLNPPTNPTPSQNTPKNNYKTSKNSTCKLY